MLQDTLARSPKMRGRTPKAGKTLPMLLQFLAMLGIAALVYPGAADWFATRTHHAQVSGYTRSVEAAQQHQDPAEELRLAQEYNSHMPAGLLRDPYSTPEFETQLKEDEAYQRYERLLAISDNGVIGALNYPRLGINLPIYHGTSEEVLTRGVGHLFGSSLPIGGPSTHSVMTSHSGLLHASLFTELPQAQKGDRFSVQVMGETRWYEVSDLATVLPEETERLRIEPNEDLVTLITCTPIGVNTHRFLVTAERVEAPVTEATQALGGEGNSAGFPWWALVFLGGSALTALLLFAPPRTKRQHTEEATC